MTTALGQLDKVLLNQFTHIILSGKIEAVHIIQCSFGESIDNCTLKDMKVSVSKGLSTNLCLTFSYLSTIEEVMSNCEIYPCTTPSLVPTEGQNQVSGGAVR